MMGLYIPLAGLAAVGLHALREQRKSLARALLVACFLPGPILLLLTAHAGVTSHNPLLFLSAGEAEALDWIEANAGPDDLVLASPEIGMFIPAHTGRRVIYGHPFETVSAEEEKALVEAYFAGSPETAGLLADRGVDFIFFGPRERELGAGPAVMPQVPVFDNAEVRIYDVRP